MNTEKRISKQYLKMNKQLHMTPRGFGASGYRWVTHVIKLIDDFGINTWLDYGCGQETLWKAYVTIRPEISVIYSGYDPAIAKKDRVPYSAELVTCTDVLEHIEPACLDNVLEHLETLTQKILFLNIAMHPANKNLPDGRNAHLIQKPAIWWMHKLGEHFVNWWSCQIPSAKGREHKDFNLYLVRGNNE